MVETIIGIAAGLIVAIIISGYYYRLGSRHRLSIYVLQAFQAMSDIDADIKKEFTASFRGTPVKNLTILELLVANEGTHPIRDCIEPLAIELPKDVVLLDVTVPYVNPEGRRIRAEETSERRFEYQFSLLNPREYFLTKIIADGHIDQDSLLITIAVDNLPPRLKAEFNERIETTRRTPIALGINLGMLVVVSFFGLLAVSVLSMVSRINKNVLPNWLQLPLLYPVSMIAIVAIILLILIATMCSSLILAILFGGSFPPAHRFPLPDAIRGNNWPIKAGLGFRVDKDGPDRI